MTPQRRVRVNGFLMGKYEVTQRQWEAVMGSFPRGMKQADPKFIGDDLPMMWGGWDDVQAFIQKLGKGYRLPSEAEWEYAARAGTQTAFAFGPAINPTVVNYNGFHPRGQVVREAGRGRTVAIGSLGWANAWGLYDMHGNVSELCEDDWYENYNGAPSDGRARVDNYNRARSRVIRGGDWYHAATYCRSAYRDDFGRRNGYLSIGFRLVRTASGR
jgi:formylglycine-generating enzyme required for sulfatase activity